MQFTFRPLPVWPHKPTENRRSRWTFRQGWEDTIILLEYELERLNAANPIIAAGFAEGDIRLDGLPRANAREPLHPGVELSFDTSLGRLVYTTDVCERWQHNVRSIALGLGALRAVDRYGITKKGEQYAGWLQLSVANDLAIRGKTLVEIAGGMPQALRLHHPDLGGDRADFEAVMAYKREGGG